MENDYYMIDFQEIKKLLWKKRSLILACAVFFALVFTVASYNRTKSEKELYAAEAAIVVMNSTSSVNKSEDNSINQSEALNTYAEILKSADILQLMVDTLNLSYTYDEMRSMITVEPVSQSFVINIRTVSTISLEEADEICDYLERIAPDVISRYDKQVNVQTISNVHKVDTPQKRKITPITMLITLVLGTVVGTCFSMAYIIIRRLLDDTIHTSDEVEHYLDRKVLGVIPKPEKGKSHQKCGEQLREAYRTLCFGLRFATNDESHRSFLLTAVEKGTNLVDLAEHIALEFYTKQKKTLLIDFNLHNKALLPSNAVGVVDILLDKASFSDSVVKGEKYDILPAGSLQEEYDRFIIEEGANKLLKQAKEQYAYTVVIAPAATLTIDAALLGRQTDGVILALDTGKTQAKSARYSIDRLEWAHTKVLGIVLTNYDTHVATERDSLYYNTAQ